MMKRILFIIFLSGIPIYGFSQVGINTTSPDAQLHIKSSDQAAPSNTDGILIPKIDAFPITNPTAAQQGMMVYLTTVSAGKQPGFYYWDNTGTPQWKPIAGNPVAADADWYEVGGTTPPDAITDAMYHTGNVAIGKNSPNYKLEVEENDSSKPYAVRVAHTNPLLNSISGSFSAAISGALAGGIIRASNNTVAASGGMDGVGLNNLMSGNSSGGITGVNNSLSTSGGGVRTGLSNAFTGSGTGLMFGVSNGFVGGSALVSTGMDTAFTGAPTGGSVGISNRILDSGNLDKVGVRNAISNSGTGSHTGIENTFSGNNALNQWGVKSEFIGTGATTVYGTHNTISSTGDMFHYGTYNAMSGTGSGEHYGTQNIMSGSGSGKQFGLENNISVSGNNVHYGVQNYLNGSGTGTHTGVRNWLSGSGSGTQYGIDNYIDNTGNGDKYGIYNRILPLGTGIHYGVYSDVRKANSYAGYFVGRFSIGSTLTDNYIMPASRGTANQVMQTDGSGNVSWVSPTTIASGTLDQAYDFGGAGAGRTITADAGAVTIAGSDGFVSTGAFGSGAIVPTGTGTRMIWNPRKAAFRVGAAATQWDDTNVGSVSVALGINTTASGVYSTAFGSGTTASGDTATAFGAGTEASYNYATAFGLNTVAAGWASTAFGIGTTAVFPYTTAFGQNTIASAAASTAFGSGTNANGAYSTAFGEGTYVSGGYATAFGRGSSASGNVATSFGRSNSAASYGETVIGIGATIYSPSVNGINQFSAANAADRLFVIGNAIDTNGNDIVESAERQNAMVVLKNGNTAIGNTTPTLARLQVEGVVGNTVAMFSRNANSQGVSLVSDWPGVYFNSYYNGGVRSMAGSGFTSIVNTDQTNGGLIFQTNNVVNPAAGSIVGTIPTRMTITAGGNVGIGTVAPGGLFELSLDQGRKPGTSAWTITSDERLKAIHGNYSKGLEEILKLQPITYNYVNSGKRIFEDKVLQKEFSGFSAQAVQKIFPEAVEVDEDGFLNFNMHPILVASVNAFKDLDRKNEELQIQIEQIKTQQQEINSLKAINSEILKRLELLEKK